MIAHLIARVNHANHRLDDPPLAAWLWKRLRRAFASTLAAVLMLDHLHVIAELESLDAARRRLGGVLSGFSRRRWPRNVRITWHPVPPPRVIPNSHHLRRQDRYVILNPCRAGLVDDPLSWPWSTYRDVVGAVVDPWVTPTRLANALGDRSKRFVETHHAYVSADPSTLISGTPLPHPVSLDEVQTKPLKDIYLAAVAATRSSLSDIRRRSPARRLFLALALRQGWTNHRLIAQICKMSPRAVREFSRRPVLSDADLAAGLLCLGDQRLTAYLQDYAKAA